MKKNMLFFTVLVVGMFAQLRCHETCEESNPCFTTAFTTGFVFKHDDCTFKQVYGRGIQNVITGDVCYYPWECWGIGAKVSYWREKGRTALFHECTLLQEVPITFYVRKLSERWCNWQAYYSLGGGVIIVKEKSYLGCVDLHKGIGEVEVGLNYSWCDCFDITGAFRYLFPRVCFCDKRIDVGGFDLRVGIGFAY